MSYQVKFTELTNPAKPALTVDDQSLNTQTSLTFVGKNYAGYGTVFAENFLHILENFAKNVPPANPIEGQLWYDNSAGINLLKVYDGTTWSPAGSVKKATTAPLVANSNSGDLWVDTVNQQLYIFSGSTWLLVGPQFSAGLKTGPDIEIITDINNNEYSVITLFSQNNRIAIVSKTSFTPKTVIIGFPIINQGINLSTVDSDSLITPTKFWGTSTNADALIVNNVSVKSTNFVRTDVTTPLDVPLSVRADAGISLGSDLSFNISNDTTSTSLFSKTSGKSIDIRVNDNSVVTTAMYIKSNTYIGVGPNNNDPQEVLDVIGNIAVSSNIIVSGTTDATSTGTGSIITAGGLSVAKQSRFNGSVTFSGNVILNNLNSNNDPIGGSVILPGYTNSASLLPLYDIGSATRKFRNIYAQSVGDATSTFQGTFTGNFLGSLSGTASALASPTVFNLTGDVESNSISFNGQTQTGTETFVTTISQTIITAKDLVSTTSLTDQLLIYRSGTNGGLKRTTKSALLSQVPFVPVGAIFPFAGDVIPAGYLLCDGSEVKQSTYIELFNVIGIKYRDITLLLGAGTFALPDLRGRFPLGRDNMDNNLTVTTGDGTEINAGGRRNGGFNSSDSANRVSDASADITGAGSGADSRSLSISNLPEHGHKLSNDTADYYAGSIAGGSLTDVNGVVGASFAAGAAGRGVSRTGGVDTPSLGTSFTTMNPYQTINYIIFTGVL